MNKALKVSLSYLEICLFPFLYVACGNKSTEVSAPKNIYEKAKVKTAKEAFELASAEKYSETPDTVFLDYWLGMPEDECKALTKRYLKEKKLKKRYFSTSYDLRISEDASIEFNVSLDCEEGFLKSVILLTPDFGFNRFNLKPLYKLENYFEPIMMEKGYFPIFQGFQDTKSESVAAQNIVRLTSNGVEQLIFDPNLDERFGSEAITFFKGNTYVMISYFGGSFPGILFGDAYVDRILREKMEQEKQLQQERDKAVREKGVQDFM